MIATTASTAVGCWVRTFVLTAGLLLVAGCASLPALDGRDTSAALTDTGTTALGRAYATQVAAHPGKSGVYPLSDAHEAFAARLAVASAAQRSLDAQYYIWRADELGSVMFKALWDAGQRGVRVRLLLDDVNTKGLDPMLLALDAHPGIDVRLYNPMMQRGVRLLNLTDFARVNRRMHNKSLTPTTR